MSETKKAPTSDDLVDIGEEHHKAGRWHDAESHYRQALEIDPGHPGALYYLANIAYEDGRAQFAAQLIEELLRSEPNDVEAWHLLGMIALKDENFARASECFKKALNIQPGYAQAHYSLGSVQSKQNNFDLALINFRQALTLNPAFAEAHCSIGNICRAQNKLDEALLNYQRAINSKPDFEIAYENAGEILLLQEKPDEAITLFRNAIAKHAGSALIHASLGSAYLSKKQSADAVASCEQAIGLDPHCFLAHFGLGTALFEQGKVTEAVAAFQKAITLNATNTRLLANLANALYSLGDIDAAAKIYRQWLELEPDSPAARHHLAACTHEEVPARAEDAYVESLFDHIADSFDAKLGNLQYRGPQLIIEALQRQCSAANKQFNILDAGCGTGLCGPLVAAYAKQLIGVDLSGGMLAKAKLRDVYDELVKAELTEYLQSKTNSFDIILSADTLLYFGALESVLTAARGATRDGGYLFFSTEVLIDDNDDNKSSAIGYCLNPHGRYSHSEDYLRRTLSVAGFSVIAIEKAILRYEYGSPVKSFLVSCRTS